MPLTIAVLGATGVYARHLIPRLVARGHAVRALVRRPDAAAIAIACGADVRVADIFDPAALRAGVSGCDVSVNLATSLPGPSGRGNYAANDRLRREGVPVWLRACEDMGVPRVFQQSIGWVNFSPGDAWADEDTCNVPDDTIAGAAITAARDMEDAARSANLDWVILRGALFYGPGTGLDDGWFDRARTGRLRLPGDGRDYVSLVHIADMANATVAAIEQWPSRQALIVADDHPAPWRDVLGYIAAIAGCAEPALGGQAGFPSARLRNNRARSTLNWEPLYADYRMGLAR
jgi:nucleoside-diphosphate-sugar epimerase